MLNNCRFTPGTDSASRASHTCRPASNAEHVVNLRFIDLGVRDLRIVPVERPQGIESAAVVRVDNQTGKLVHRNVFPEVRTSFVEQLLQPLLREFFVIETSVEELRP